MSAPVTRRHRELALRTLALDELPLPAEWIAKLDSGQFDCRWWPERVAQALADIEAAAKAEQAPAQAKLETKVHPIVYIAHPLRGATLEATAHSRKCASALTAKLSAQHKIAPVCSWVVLSEHWTEEEGRELGLSIDCALIERCDELWLCGPHRPLSAGMQIEHDHAVKCGVRVVDKRGACACEQANPDGPPTNAELVATVRGVQRLSEAGEYALAELEKRIGGG